MSKQLLEAAAEVLAKSKTSAPAMPMEKSSAEVEDLGGDTPDHREDDNPDAAKSVKKTVAPTTKPSAASSKVVDRLQKMNEAKDEDEDEDEENEEDEDMEDDEEEMKDDEEKKKMNEKYYKESAYNKKHMKENIEDDIKQMFSSEENLSEDFRQKASVIFEARVNDRVSQIEDALLEQFNASKDALEMEYAELFENAVETIKEEMAEKLNDYLNYVVQEWVSENELAIESGLRNELAEDFMVGLKNLFLENYIEIPQNETNLIEELVEKVESLETKLNEEIENSIFLKKQLDESLKVGIVNQISEGLTTTQVEKIKSLAEGITFTTEDEYREKLETIKENYFPNKVKKTSEVDLNEQVEGSDTDTKKIFDPRIAAYAQAITKTSPKY